MILTKWTVVATGIAMACVARAGPPPVASAPPIVITRQPLCEGRITNQQCGQFIEYLCNLVPGMWAEKLYDGGFEGLSPYKFEFIRQTDFRERPWYPSGAVNRGKYSLDPDRPVSGAVSQKIQATDGPPCTLGISQDGIYVEKGKPCVFRCWLRQQGLSRPVEIRLHHEQQTYASCIFVPTEQWKKYEAELIPAGGDENATLSVTFHGPAALWIDNASLMPQETQGGWRPDVTAALRALHPGVIRFGGSALDSPGYGGFEWRDTIGDMDHRKPFRAWGGLQPVGPGLEEIVQLMQAAGAQPLICVRIRERTPHDAADEVEYFNGSVETPMGKRRSENGHRQPYHIKYWQIGNEQSGPDYERRLPEFCQAMKRADPAILLLASYPTPGVLRGAGQWTDYVCPHHYECGNLAATARNFDDVRAMLRQYAPGRNIHIAVTEWNTTAGDAGPMRATLWDLANALACARYQNLLHRQCDLVDIACRSNLCNSFCSGIIQTDNHRIYLTPTGYMQQLYATVAGDKPLKIEPNFALDSLPDFSATLSSDGRTVTLFAVNPNAAALSRTLDFSAFGEQAEEISVWTLADHDRAGAPDVTNSFGDPMRVAPAKSTLHPPASRFDYRFPAFSITVLQRGTAR